MNAAQQTNNERIDGKYQTKRDDKFDDARNIQPNLWGLKPSGNEKAKCFRDEEFRVDMRDKEQAARQTQDVHFVGQIKILQIVRHASLASSPVIDSARRILCATVTRVTHLARTAPLKAFVAHRNTAPLIRALQARPRVRPSRSRYRTSNI
jgi:hypothetical protein